MLKQHAQETELLKIHSIDIKIIKLKYNMILNSKEQNAKNNLCFFVLDNTVSA